MRAFHAPLLAVLGPRLSLPPDLIVVLATLGGALLLNVPARGLVARARGSALGPADRVLGIGLQGFTVLVIAYLALATLASIEGAAGPVLASGRGQAISPAQVEAFARAVRRDPLLTTLVSDAQLAADRQGAGAGRLTGASLQGQYPWLRWYLTVIRPAFLTSRLAPVLLRDGNRIPWVGRPGTAIP